MKNVNGSGVEGRSITATNKAEFIAHGRVVLLAFVCLPRHREAEALAFELWSCGDLYVYLHLLY